MPINVSEAIDADTAIVVTVERVTGGYVDGLWVKDAPTTFKTLASPQQPTPQDLQNLPEGERNKNIRKFITKKAVRTASDKDGLNADIIIYRSIRYKIIQVMDWDEFGHTTCMAARD